MPDEKNKGPKIVKPTEYLYNHSSNHVTVPTTGCIGAFNENGEIIVHFFLERMDYPTKTIINEKGERFDEYANVIRDVLTTVVMNHKTAIRVGEWLIRVAIDYQNTMKKISSNQKQENTDGPA